MILNLQHGYSSFSKGNFEAIRRMKFSSCGKCVYLCTNGHGRWNFFLSVQDYIFVVNNYRFYWTVGEWLHDLFLCLAGQVGFLAYKQEEGKKVFFQMSELEDEFCSQDDVVENSCSASPDRNGM